MTRIARPTFGGHACHVLHRGVDRMAIFDDDGGYHLSLVRRTAAALGLWKKAGQVRLFSQEHCASRAARLELLMTRIARPTFGGHACHVLHRGVDRMAIFDDDGGYHSSLVRRTAALGLGAHVSAARPAAEGGSGMSRPDKRSCPVFLPNLK